MVAVLIIAAVILFGYYVYYKMTTIFTYWKNKGIKGPKPHLIFGNIKDCMWTKKYNISMLSEKLYNDYPTEKVVGFYQGLQPSLLVRDPEIMKTILIKDFSHFTDRGVNFSKEPITRNLFATDGKDWKMLRQKLTPVFTTGKLKNMISILNQCAEIYVEHVYSLADRVTPQELTKLNMKYTMKCITSVAFGLDISPFEKETTEFEEMAQKIFRISKLHDFVFLLNNYWQGIADILHLPVETEGTYFFLKLVKTILQEREGKPKVRKDLIDLLIELKEQGKVSWLKDDAVEEIEMTDELITAQALVFYAAGFGTSTGTISFLFYELAFNNDVQENCYEEICKVMKKYDGKLDYDALKEMKYVSAAVDETLRKYPIAANLFRQAVTDYTFKDINLTIDKGTKIWIPVLPLQNDPKYYPTPETFAVSRFNQENKEALLDVYMPFGDGPRKCIGLRYAQVQVMVGVAHFLHKFKVTPCEKTVKKIRFDPRHSTLSSADGIWLNIEKRKA